MGAPLGEPGGGLGGSFTKGPEDFERKALGMGISLHGGSVGATWSGFIYRGL